MCGGGWGSRARRYFGHSQLTVRGSLFHGGVLSIWLKLNTLYIRVPWIISVPDGHSSRKERRQEKWFYLKILILYGYCFSLFFLRGKCFSRVDIFGCCHANSNRRAAISDGNPWMNIVISHGPFLLVFLAPPFFIPLLCFQIRCVGSTFLDSILFIFVYCFVIA